MPKAKLENRGKERNIENPLEITLKFSKDQKQAKNNINSEMINHLIPEIRECCSVDVNVKKDSIHRSFSQLKINNQISSTITNPTIQEDRNLNTTPNAPTERQIKNKDKDHKKFSR